MTQTEVERWIASLIVLAVVAGLWFAMFQLGRRLSVSEGWRRLALVMSAVTPLVFLIWNVSRENFPARSYFDDSILWSSTLYAYFLFGTFGWFTTRVAGWIVAGFADRRSG